MRTHLALASCALLLGCQDFAQSTEFAPDSDSFAFPNFGGIVAPAMLDSGLMMRLFGDSVCEPGSVIPEEDRCSLIPEGTQWMLQVNQSMSGGRCEGLAVLSQAFWEGIDSPDNYGAAAAAGLPISDNNPLNREIAYWYATQNLSEVAAASEGLTAEEALTRLSQEFAEGKLVSRLGIVRLQDGVPTGGHAVTPYAIEERDDGAYDLLLYDSNHPGEERRMLVDPSANTWEYMAAVNPSDEGALYAGDESNGNPLWLAPLEARLGSDHCLMCEGSTTQLGSALVSGPVQPQVGNCEGDAAGYTDDGSFAYQAGEITVRPSFSGLWNDAAGLAFYTPAEGDVCMTTTGLEPNADERDRLSMGLWRPGRRMVQVAGPVGGGAHSLTSTQGGLNARYDTDVEAGGPLALSGKNDNGSRLFVRLETDAAPQSLGVGIEPSEGDATVDLGAETAQRVRLQATRTEGARRETFLANLDALPGVADLTLKMGEWAGEGTPLTIEVDEDGDGTVDDTLQVDDCQIAAECPPLFGDDGDEVADEDDNCPDAFNPGQEDRDLDGVGDVCDPCADDDSCFCAAGSQDEDSDPNTPCTACAAGEYCAGGDEPAVACGGETFDHDLDPATACRNCDEGFSSPDGLICE